MTDFNALLLFAFASVGMTFILVEGSIFYPMRESFRRQVEKIEHKRQRGKKVGWTFSEFAFGILTCHQCCGFWCGIFVALLIFPFNFSLTDKVLTSNGIQTATSLMPIFRSFCGLFVFGCATSVLAILFFRIFDICHAVAGYYHAHTPMPEYAHHHEETEAETMGWDAQFRAIQSGPPEEPGDGQNQ